MAVTVIFYDKNREMTATGDICSTYSEMTMKICDGYEKR